MAIQNLIGGGVGAGVVATSVTAAGTTQGTATELPAADSEVTTVAANSGVILNRLIAPGEQQSIFNAGANSLKVYPPSGMQFNALPTNSAISLSTNTGVLFRCVSTTRIFGVLSA